PGGRESAAEALLARELRVGWTRVDRLVGLRDGSCSPPAFGAIGFLAVEQRHPAFLDPGERGLQALFAVQSSKLCLDDGRLAECGEELIRRHALVLPPRRRARCARGCAGG